MNELDGKGQKVFKDAQEARKIFTQVYQDSAKSTKQILENLKKELAELNTKSKGLKEEQLRKDAE